MAPRASDEDLACFKSSVAAPRAPRSTRVHAEDDAGALVSALARAFARAVQHDMEHVLHGESVEPAELRAAVQAYVARLKAIGAPPESVVVAVKAATASGALLAWQSHDTRREATALTERVVRWCVQAYYAGGAS